MAADDDTQDTVRRILQKRPPEALPAGAEDRLRKRLDQEAARPRSRRKPPASVSKPHQTATKASKASARRR